MSLCDAGSRTACRPGCCDTGRSPGRRDRASTLYTGNTLLGWSAGTSPGRGRSCLKEICQVLRNMNERGFIRLKLSPDLTVWYILHLYIVLYIHWIFQRVLLPPWAKAKWIRCGVLSLVMAWWYVKIQRAYRYAQGEMLRRLTGIRDFLSAIRRRPEGHVRFSRSTGPSVSVWWNALRTPTESLPNICSRISSGMSKHVRARGSFLDTLLTFDPRE